MLVLFCCKNTAAFIEKIDVVELSQAIHGIVRIHHSNRYFPSTASSMYNHTLLILLVLLTTYFQRNETK